MTDIQFYYSGNLTFGGIPKEEAWHWDDRTYKLFGDIVYKLTSGMRAMRTQAYNDYYHLKRYFMLDEWDELIVRLEEHRAKLGAKQTIEEIIQEISKQVVANRGIAGPAEGDVSKIPELEKVAPVKSTPSHVNTSGEIKHENICHVKESEVCEQLSLFG